MGSEGMPETYVRAPRQHGEYDGIVSMRFIGAEGESQRGAGEHIRLPMLLSFYPSHQFKRRQYRERADPGDSCMY